ncbi:MAG: hypothetical protein Tsb002_17920 [Wenzhouxiangellaceae bacterium]
MDAAGQLTYETITDLLNGNYSAHYVYDAVGNRTSSTIDGVTVSYSYDANDRLISNGAWQYEYDANGNTLREHAGADEKVYSYNRANRLIAATVTINGVSETKAFEYDNAGIRVSSRDNSNNLTEYLIDRNRDYAQVIIEDAPSGITAYSYGDDLLSQNRAGAVSYYHYDGLGSTRALSDNSGALTDSYAYEAFGTLLNQSGATSNDYLYTGEQYDTELSQYYLRARYYNPTIGRFTQMDTWMGRNHDPVTLHKYLYANADPVGHVDPSGNISTLTGITIGTTVLGGLTGAAVGGYFYGAEGAVVGGIAGSLAGYYAGVYFAWEIYSLVPTATTIIQTWAVPTNRFVQGPIGRVSLRQLDKLSTSQSIELYTNLSRQIEFLRTIHLTTSRALASAGPRANYTTYIARIPQGVIIELRRIGLVNVTITEEMTATGVVRAFEYEFLPSAAAYIYRGFFSMIKYCCEAMENVISNQGKKGLSIIASRISDERLAFFMIFRAMDDGVENTPLLRDGDARSIQLAVEIGIGFCPWCGRRLERFYKKCWQEIGGNSILI